MPGKTSSGNGNWFNAGLKHKPLLFQQINTYNPDVIIFGYTYELFYEDLKLSKPEETDKSEGRCQFIMKNSKIYINAYHPNQRQFGQEIYVNDIIHSVKAYGEANTQYSNTRYRHL